MDISDTKELGRVLRVFRKTHNLTQEQLAAQSGVGVRFLRELESGKPGCQIGKALSVLAMLGLEMRIAPRDVFGGLADGVGSGDGSGDGKGTGSGVGVGDGSGEG